jgi:dihydrofolate reductase
MKNVVYIATSIDGYIADKDGGVDWLNTIPNPNNDDLGWAEFISTIDCIVMGRNTFEKVLSFNVPWPYPVPVFVLSNSMNSIPEGYDDKIKILNGNPHEITKQLDKEGFKRAYIDGGKTVQKYLAEDLVDEITITKIPIMLGDGIPLFESFNKQIIWDHVETKILLDHLVKTKYVKKI